MNVRYATEVGAGTLTVNKKTNNELDGVLGKGTLRGRYLCGMVYLDVLRPSSATFQRVRLDKEQMKSLGEWLLDCAEAR